VAVVDEPLNVEHRPTNLPAINTNHARHTATRFALFRLISHHATMTPRASIPRA
jgi:hypothetical protein